MSKHKNSSIIYTPTSPAQLTSKKHLPSSASTLYKSIVTNIQKSVSNSHLPGPSKNLRKKSGHNNYSVNLLKNNSNNNHKVFNVQSATFKKITTTRTQQIKTILYKCGCQGTTTSHHNLSHGKKHEPLMKNNSRMNNHSQALTTFENNPSIEFHLQPNDIRRNTSHMVVGNTPSKQKPADSGASLCSKIRSTRSVNGINVDSNSKLLVVDESVSNSSSKNKVVLKSKYLDKSTAEHIKKAKSRLRKLKIQYNRLLAKSQQPLEPLTTPVKTQIRYIEVPKVVDKVYYVQRPVQTIQKNIKKVPRQMVKFEEIVIEKPVIREELVFVDAQKLAPIVESRKVEVQKTVEVKQPNRNNLEWSDQLSRVREKSKDTDERVRASQTSLEDLRSKLVSRKQQKSKEQEEKRRRAESASKEQQQLRIEKQKQWRNRIEENKRQTEARIREIEQANRKTRLEIEQRLLNTRESINHNNHTNTIAYNNNNNANQSQNRSVSTVKSVTSQWSDLNRYKRIEENGVIVYRKKSDLIQNVESRLVVEHSPAVTSQSLDSKGPRIIRKYCKKDCGEVCDCMKDMFKIITVPSQR